MPLNVIIELDGDECPFTADWVFDEVEGYFIGVRAMRKL